MSCSWIRRALKTTLNIREITKGSQVVKGKLSTCLCLFRAEGACILLFVSFSQRGTKRDLGFCNIQIRNDKLS